MSLKSFARNRTRVLVGGLVMGIAVAGALVSPSEAATPPGSPFQVFVDTTSSAAPADAISSGWWGHEGAPNNGTGTVTSFLDVDGADPDLATTFPDLGKVQVAFVATSADGSAEHPAVTAGETVGSAFTWFMDAGIQTGLNGNANPNDSVNTVSTGAEFNLWDAAGQPVQGYDNSLVPHDVNAPGNPVSAAPKGKSILNRWAAGAHISLVFYATTGAVDSHGQPIVAVGSDGHAITAYMPFITVAKPSDATRSSAGYQTVGAAYAPTVSVSHAFVGTTATLTATVKNNALATATDATGSMKFAQYSGGVDGTPTEVPVTNGVATLQVPGFTPGTSKTYHVTYVPDVAAQDAYLTSSVATHTVTAPTATTTALTVVGGATDTLTATATPKVAGTVVFKDGATTLGTVPAPAGVAKLAKKLTVGKHVLTATFTPTSSAYTASTGSRTVFQGTIATTLTPKKGKHGLRPKVTVKIVAPGTTVSGKVIIVFDPPKGATKKFTVAVTNGVAVLKLPKTVKGKTKVTALYGGSSTVLAVNGTTVVFTAK
jgi:hypothetical protein